MAKENVMMFLRLQSEMIKRIRDSYSESDKNEGNFDMDDSQVSDSNDQSN